MTIDAGLSTYKAPEVTSLDESHVIVLHGLRWSRCSGLAFGTQVLGFKHGRSRRIFSGEKILSTPSFVGEVKPSVPCRALGHVKELKSDVEVANFDKIFGHFSPIVLPSAAGFASVASDAGGLLWRALEHSKCLVLLQIGVRRAAGNDTL
jgi:hypothetical protein